MCINYTIYSGTKITKMYVFTKISAFTFNWINIFLYQSKNYNNNNNFIISVNIQIFVVGIM